MKILLFRETELKELNPYVLEHRGLAATESCVVGLAQELSRKHTIKVIAPQFKQQFFGKVEYIPFQSYAEVLIHIAIFDPDILIIVGNPQILVEHSFKQRTIFWQQNHPNEMDFRFPIKEILSKTLIVAPSPEAANYYNKHYKTNKIIGIYNGIRNVFFNKLYMPDTNKIVYIGAFTRAKGLSIFLQTAKKYPEYTFYCIGDFDLYGFTDEIYKEYCKRLAQECQNLIFCGNLNAEQLVKELQTATMCIVNPLINNNETCCVSALEAIVLNVPVIGGESEILSNIFKNAGQRAVTTTCLIETIKKHNYELLFYDKKFIENLKWSSIIQYWERLCYEYNQR
jgi:glycosyltransferase involved in cell wall biosynthesis